MILHHWEMGPKTIYIISQYFNNLWTSCKKHTDGWVSVTRTSRFDFGSGPHPDPGYQWDTKRNLLFLSEVCTPPSGRPSLCCTLGFTQSQSCERLILPTTKWWCSIGWQRLDLSKNRAKYSYFKLCDCFPSTLFQMLMLILRIIFTAIKSISNKYLLGPIHASLGKAVRLNNDTNKKTYQQQQQKSIYFFHQIFCLHATWASALERPISSISLDTRVPG